MAASLARIDRELGELAPSTGRAEEGAMAELLALGVSHKTAPLELRERLALTEGRAVGVLGELRRASEEVHEAAAISTCNRTELYLVVTDPVEAEAVALGAARPRGRDRADRAGRAPLLAARPWRPPSTCSGSPPGSTR